MSKNKMKIYGVRAKCIQYVNVEIRAMNLDDALAKSKEMKECEFVQVNGEYWDGSFRITGVLEND